ncbi:hypothetical protein GGX14DRAFT_394781 [Mycena pura]|uniref:Helicase C-terminal domain-containing protein n=1 Tax=Mycena pura TaxID=153505 RepID=A0AAD6VHQ3_9AGAR|nr:hypothetical protein GGX14DRAFT_394781 [Mycena pura]
MQEFLVSLQAKLEQRFMQRGDQGIIFYPSPNVIKNSKDASSCASWNGWEKRHEHEDEWLSGKHTFMNATTTCSLGIDNGRCNVVIFADFLPGLVNIVQSAARGGRRGQQTLAIFVTSHGHKYRPGTMVDGDPDCVVEGAKMLNTYSMSCASPLLTSLLKFVIQHVRMATKSPIMLCCFNRQIKDGDKDGDKDGRKHAGDSVLSKQWLHTVCTR